MSWSRRQWAEACLLVSGAVLATHLAFGQVFGPTRAHHPVEYVIFPFVIAAAVRGGPPVTAPVVLAASAVTIWNTVRGAGPFAGPEVHEGLVLLQAFMGVLAGTGLLLAAAIAERATARAAGPLRILWARSSPARRAWQTRLPRSSALSAKTSNGRSAPSGWSSMGPRRLRCLALWSDEATQATAFAAVSRDTAFDRGIGLPGRVWATGEAAWIENVVHDRNFPRAPVARDAGVHGAFAFPIRLGEEVLGIIECFNRAVAPPDPDLLRTMSSVGNQIGQFMGRKREETRSTRNSAAHPPSSKRRWTR